MIVQCPIHGIGHDDSFECALCRMDKGPANEQTRLLNEPCVRCGHVGELLIEQHDGMVCVKCITQDNGEDGDPGA